MSEISTSNEQKGALKRNNIISAIPPNVKKDFKEVGFVCWNGNWLPVIQLGPDDIPVSSSARKEFLRYINYYKV